MEAVLGSQRGMQLEEEVSGRSRKRGSAEGEISLSVLRRGQSGCWAASLAHALILHHAARGIQNGGRRIRPQGSTKNRKPRPRSPPPTGRRLVARPRTEREFRVRVLRANS